MWFWFLVEITSVHHKRYALISSVNVRPYVHTHTCLQSYHLNYWWNIIWYIIFSFVKLFWCKKKIKCWKKLHIFILLWAHKMYLINNTNLWFLFVFFFLKFYVYFFQQRVLEVYGNNKVSSGLQVSIENLPHLHCYNIKILKNEGNGNSLILEDSCYFLNLINISMYSSGFLNWENLMYYRIVILIYRIFSSIVNLTPG